MTSKDYAAELSDYVASGGALRAVWGSKLTKAGKPPQIADWRRGAHPTPSLPIDNVISKLLKPNAKVKYKCAIRPAATLQAEWKIPFCPYYQARMEILIAASWAKLSYESDREGKTVEKPALTQMHKDALAIANLIEHFEKRWYSQDLNGAAVFNARHRLHSFLNEHFDLFRPIKQAEDNFRSIAAEALNEKAVAAPGGSPDGLWSRVFIKHVGFFFFFLTGKVPGKTIFQSFANACFNSLFGHGNAEEALSISESSMRTVLGKMRGAKHWDVRMGPYHIRSSDKPNDPEEIDRNFWATARQSARDVLEDLRYLPTFCDLVVMGGDQAERELRQYISEFKKLPNWHREYSRAVKRNRS